MAIGRLNQRVGKVGKGLAHFSYIMREDKYRNQAEKLEKFENSDHGNMPDWAKTEPILFWKAADQNERKNGSTYRENIIALPRELNEDQRLELVKDWIKNELGDKHPYTFAIHTPKALDGDDQPHVHLMWSERTLDGIERGPDQFFKRYNSKHPERGGCEKSNKNSTWTDRKAELVARRMRWQDLCNSHLEKAGFDVRIDMRNWKERGLEQEPVNIAMSEINKPEIRQAYQQKLLLKRESEQSERQWQVFYDEREIARTDRFIENTELQLERTAQSNAIFARRIYETDGIFQNRAGEQDKGMSIFEDPNVFITWASDYIDKYKVEQALEQEQLEFEQERQRQAWQEKLRLERERQERAKQEEQRIERVRQEQAQQEQRRLEQERYRRSMLIEYPFFDTPLAQLARPQLKIKIIKGGGPIQKQFVSLEHALNFYKQFASKNWMADTGETIVLEFEGVDQNNKTEQLMCDRFIELADKKETQKLNELVHDFLTKTPFEIHLIRMAELTGEMSAVRYNAYSEKINYYSKLDFQIQRDGFSMANKLQNNAQPDEINKNQSKIKIEQLIKNLDCKKYYESRQHRDLNLVEFLQQTNATISKSELEKVNDTIEELIVAEQAQQEQLQLEQERQAQAELKYRGPTRENHASNTRDRDDGPSFNF